MSIDDISIKQQLTGDNAFYNHPNYKEITLKEMASSQAPKMPIYSFNTESKVWRVVKDIFSIIIFPIGLCRLLHSLAGKLIIPASRATMLEHADMCRKAIDLDDEWKVKRISVKVDGYIIDASIIGKASTLGNGRWMLASNGNGEFYEAKFHVGPLRPMISELNSNAIIFNYPGVCGSSGMPSRNGMAKAYRAMLNFLEDQNKGIGAKEIIGYGMSIGGGVQGEALRTHELKQGINYTFVKDRTFSDLSTAAAHISNSPKLNKVLGFLVKILGWNLGSLESSKKLKAPEIIMQTTDIDGKIRHDEVIAREASLAYHLLDHKQSFQGKKYFMSISESHNEGINNPTRLVEKINEMLIQ